MAAAFDGDACILHRLQRLHVDLRGYKQCFPKGRAQTVIICTQRFLRHAEHPAHQRKSVAVHAGGSDTDQRIARLDIRSGDQVLLIHNAYRKARQIVLVFRIETRHLCRLSADQRRSRLEAAFCHAAYDRGNLLRIVLPAGNIVQKEQRFSSCTGDIVHTHGHTVDPHCIMPVQKERQLQLCPHSVRTGYQRGFLHVFKCTHGKCARETAQAAQHLRSHGLLHMLLHKLYRSVTGLDVNTCILIIHSLPPD